MRATKNQLANLRTFDKITKKEQRAIASRAGKKSVEARRQKKKLRESLQLILDIKAEELARDLRKAGQKEIADQVEQVGLIAYRMTEIIGSRKIKAETRLKAMEKVIDILEPNLKKDLNTQNNFYFEAASGSNENIDKLVGSSTTSKRKSTIIDII